MGPAGRLRPLEQQLCPEQNTLVTQRTKNWKKGRFPSYFAHSEYSLQTSAASHGQEAQVVMGYLSLLHWVAQHEGLGTDKTSDPSQSCSTRPNIFGRGAVPGSSCCSSCHSRAALVSSAHSSTPTNAFTDHRSLLSSASTSCTCGLNSSGGTS